MKTPKKEPNDRASKVQNFAGADKSPGGPKPLAPSASGFSELGRVRRRRLRRREGGEVAEATALLECAREV